MCHVFLCISMGFFFKVLLSCLFFISHWCTAKLLSLLLAKAFLHDKVAAPAISRCVMKPKADFEFALRSLHCLFPHCIVCLYFPAVFWSLWYYLHWWQFNNCSCHLSACFISGGVIRFFFKVLKFASHKCTFQVSLLICVCQLASILF